MATIARDISVQKRAERTFKGLLEFAPDAIVGVRESGRIALANRQAETLFGYSRDELLDTPVELLVPPRFVSGHAAHRDGYFGDLRTRAMGAGVELYGMRKDGTEFPAEISLSSLETDEGVVAVAAVRDVSERAESERERTLSEELNQSRRLESVGQLAGGVAHDFNNLLGVIINFATFVAEALPADSPAREDIEEIRQAAKRGAALTRQLLIFSRREVIKPEILDLNELVSGFENFLRRALGEQVELDVVPQDDLWTIQADRGQMEQVLVNLAVNGRDAMPDGGKLIVETANVVLDEQFVGNHVGLSPGDYVRLTVSDSGVGMDDEVIARAFEPFYTTKPKGEGTGLGLATVYGIVTEAGGRVILYSEPGLGTSVKIHLPACTASVSLPHAPAEAVPAGRGETLLVVEDEADVRRMSERILTRAGYSVLMAANGDEALRLAASEDFDLVLTDVVMPGMTGPDLVGRIRVMYPDMRVVYMSGYSHRMLTHETLERDARSAFIEKPFTADELQRKLRELLDAAPQPVAPAHVVLYIEDNPLNIKVAERILSRRPDVSLLVATRGEPGLDLARAHRPALVVLDLNLPGISGEQLLRRLRDDARTATTPVVIASGDATPGVVERLRQAGADDHLLKPYEAEELLALVDRFTAHGARPA